MDIGIQTIKFLWICCSRYGNNGLKNMISEFRKLETDAFVYEALETALLHILGCSAKV